MSTQKSSRIVRINIIFNNKNVSSLFCRYHINPIPKNCSESLDCFCSLFYNYSRLISDVLFYNDYYRFILQHIKYSNKTFLYHYSHRTSQKHPSPCKDYLHKHNFVGHFAELEYTWGTPLLFNKTNDVTPLFNYVTYTANATNNYSKKQIEFSQQMIEQWSNFIKYGQPNSTRFQNQWIPFVNISNGSIMHLKLNQSEMKPFEIPANVQFWMNTCSATDTSSMIYDNDQITIEEIEWIVVACTGLFFAFFVSYSTMQSFDNVVIENQ